jgi:hypothetical protein
VLPLTPTIFDFVYFSAALVIQWVLLFLLSVQRLGRRGLWGLIGAPLLFCWPATFILLSWSCRHGYECAFSAPLAPGDRTPNRQCSHFPVRRYIDLDRPLLTNGDEPELETRIGSVTAAK